jgi:DNA-binding response OmpR family regulator
LPCARNVERDGGQIGGHSSKGKNIVLPGVLKDAAQVEKILVVDDEPDIVRIVAKSLAGDGYEVITANNGSECIAKAEDELPALILLDSVMPNVSGDTTLLRLKAARKTRGIPVIIVTALAGADDIARAQMSGATDYVVKPFHYGVLLEKITKALECKRRGLKQPAP